MISEFGQTPAQLFDENQPHPPRKVIKPVPEAPLPGYLSSTSQSPEISHTLVHILLEVSASESMHSVLSSPQPKPQPAAPLTPALSASSPLAAMHQDRLGSPSGPQSADSAGGGGGAMHLQGHGLFPALQEVRNVCRLYSRTMYGFVLTTVQLVLYICRVCILRVRWVHKYENPAIGWGTYRCGGVELQARTFIGKRRLHRSRTSGSTQEMLRLMRSRRCGGVGQASTASAQASPGWAQA